MNTPPFKLQEIRHVFNAAADTFEQNAILHHEIAQRLNEHLDLIRLQPKIIIDLGAKTGLTTQLLKKRFPEATVVAVDIAEKMLQQTKKKAGWFKSQSCVCSSLENLPFLPNSVDVIFSNLALPWCTDFSKCLQQIFQILRPGGLFIFSTLGPTTLIEMKQSWMEVDNATHVHSFIDMHDIGDALKQQGFSDPVMEMEYLTFTYSDVFAAMNEIKATGQHNLAVNRARGLTGKAKFRKFLAVYERYRRSEGGIPVTFEINYGHAWKLGPGNANNEFIIPISKIGRR